MNKKNQSIIIILLLCIFSLYSKAQNNLFTTQLSKNHSSILTLHENATFTTQPLTRTSNSNHFQQQKISIQNQPVFFENTFEPKINLTNQAFSSINKVSGDTGAQDPPEAPLNSDLQLFLILLTLYLSIKK